jgi:hypothetical protein
VLDDGAVAALSEPARTDLDTLIAEQVIQFREAPETAAAIIDRGCAAYFAAEEAAIEAEQANLEARRARLEADRAAPRDRLAIESARPLVLVESTVHVFDDAPVRVSRGHGRTIALEKGCNVVDASALENLPETALATLASCTIRPARAQYKQATTLAASRTRTVQTHPMNLS